MPGAIAVSPAGLQRTGVSKGACVGLSRNTTKRAGSVELALRPTLWISSGPS